MLKESEEEKTSDEDLIKTEEEKENTETKRKQIGKYTLIDDKSKKKIENIEINDGYDFKPKNKIGKEYTEYSPKEMKASAINTYFASNRVPGYQSNTVLFKQFVMPTLADAPQRLFFNLPVFNLESEISGNPSPIVEKIYETILAEHNRVYHAKNQIKNKKGVFDAYKYQSFTKYHMFPFLNELVEKIEKEQSVDLETLNEKYNKTVGNGRKTIKGERVKSIEELVIANFLFLSKDDIGSSRIIKFGFFERQSYINNINANAFFSP